jgi:hypothetical protein
MRRIKTYSTLAGVFFFLTSCAQSSYPLKFGNTTPSYRVGVGMAESLRPRMQLEQGTVSLRPVRSINFLIDYHQSINNWLLNLDWGSRVMFSFYKGWWDLSREVSYYQPSLSSLTLGQFDQAELFLYLRQQKVFLHGKKISWAFFWQAGPAFSVNSHLHRMEGLVETRSDNGAALQVCTVTQERKQPVWLPYLRAGAGVDLIFNQRCGPSIVLNSFFEIAALHQDRLRFTTLPADPVLSSSGYFKWNRHQAGFKFSIQRTKIGSKV